MKTKNRFYSKDEVIELLKKCWKAAESQYDEDWTWDEDAQDEINFITFSKEDVNEWIKENVG
jgi:hypothetical protein